MNALYITLACIQWVKAHQQFEQSAFPAAGMAGKGHVLPFSDLQVQMVDDRQPFRSPAGALLHLVGEAGVPDTQAAKLLPVIPGDLSGRQPAGIPVVGIGLGLHQALGAGDHGVILGHHPCNARHRRLHLPHQLQNGGKGAVRHRPLQDAITAVERRQEVAAFGQPPEAKIEQVGKAVPLQAGGLVPLHPGGGLGAGLVLHRKDPDDHHAFQPLLDKGQHRRPCLLDALVHPLEDLPQGNRQHQHDAARRHQNVEKRRFQEEQSRQRSAQPGQQAGQPGQQVHHIPGHHRRIRGQPRHPVPRVARRNRGVILVQQAVEQPLLEAVFQRGPRPLGDQAVRCIQEHLPQGHGRQSGRRPQKGLHLPRRGPVHQIAEQQGIRHAAGSQHHVQQGDAHHCQLVPAGYLPQPAQGILMFLRALCLPAHALGETPP